MNNTYFSDRSRKMNAERRSHRIWIGCTLRKCGGGRGRISRNLPQRYGWINDRILKWSLNSCATDFIKVGEFSKFNIDHIHIEKTLFFLSFIPSICGLTFEVEESVGISCNSTSLVWSPERNEWIVSDASSCFHTGVPPLSNVSSV